MMNVTIVRDNKEYKRIRRDVAMRLYRENDGKIDLIMHDMRYNLYYCDCCLHGNMCLPTNDFHIYKDMYDDEKIAVRRVFENFENEYMYYNGTTRMAYFVVE